MPAIVNWLLRLLLTNPICMRLVQGGSRRQRHMLLRSGYLAVMIFVLLFAMIGMAPGFTVRQLATRGAQVFTMISYLQIGLICLLTPIFMAGAIAQEANPRTWDIMLTTPLGNLQIVLGNLFGRLFFILALLFSTLPLFALTQYYGGVPGDSIFSSYAVAAAAALLVAAIAITLSVNRTAGKRAVFWFYAAVIMYLFITYAIDAGVLRPRNPTATGARSYYTTWLTPLNPFLALEALLSSNTYVVHDFTGSDAGWLSKMWMSRPIATFVWICVLLSTVMSLFSTLRVRIIGARTGTVPWYKKIFRGETTTEADRVARSVGHNPIAWRESEGRGKTPVAIAARWSFIALGIGIGLAMILLYHFNKWSALDLQIGLLTALSAEIVVIALVALNTSATAVSREREDGTLDLILTTPIQPGPYLFGKLRGLIQFLLPLMLVPFTTIAITSTYVIFDGFGHGASVTNVPLAGIAGTAGTIASLPLMLPEAILTLPLVTVPFLAFCVIVGLHWSVRSKGTIGSVVAAVMIVAVVAGVLGLCGMPAGKNIQFVGAGITAHNPLNLLWANIFPGDTIPKSIQRPLDGRLALVIGAGIAAGLYSITVYAIHTQMKRSFMMTVRRLAGLN